MVGVEIVQADCVMADPDLARAGIADLDIFPDEHFGTAGLVESNRFGHCNLLGKPASARELSGIG